MNRNSNSGNSKQAAGSSSRSHSASSRSSGHSGKNASGAAVDKDAQRRGGQHSHGGR
jgi:hypothetical protein